MRSESRIGALGLAPAPALARVLAMALLLVLVPFIPAIADPASEPERGDPGTTTETQSESSNATRNGEPAEGDAGESPAAPFIPSETISADSAISFPVDI